MEKGLPFSEIPKIQAMMGAVIPITRPIPLHTLALPFKLSRFYAQYDVDEILIKIRGLVNKPRLIQNLDRVILAEN
jgi:hypothetical protein